MESGRSTPVSEDGRNPSGDVEQGLSQAIIDRLRKQVKFTDPNGYHSDSDAGSEIGKSKLPVDNEVHELFIQMDELSKRDDGRYEWKQRSRWIRFEEDVLEGAERWGKPHVSSLSFHSMLQLRNCIETGAMILDLQDADLSSIMNSMVDEMIHTQHIKYRDRGNIINSLLVKHSFQEENSGFMRRKTLAFIGLDDFKEGEAPRARRNSVFGPREYRFSEPYVAFSGKAGRKNSKMGTDNNGLNLDGDVIAPMRKQSAPVGDKGSEIKVDLDLMKKIPMGAQTTSVLVGQVDYLEEPVMAFVRLSRGRYLGNFTQVPLPVRFIFVLITPANSDTLDYLDVGRAISTLMTNKKFKEAAYTATRREHLLDGLKDFLDDSLVLPPGELDRKTVMPVLNMVKEKARKRKQKKAEKQRALLEAKQEEAEEDEKPPFDPLARTGRPFGGAINDIKQRLPLYWSDVKDGLNLQCLSAFFFIYFAALAPAITFGGLLSDKTEKWIGVSEMLAGVAFMGIIFHLVAAQPLLIIGFTGPLLIFEEGLYQLSESVGLEYISFRVWIGFWLTAITVVVICFEGSFLVKLVSRFTEEVFAALISLIFIIEVFVKLAKIFDQHPLMESYCDDSVVDHILDTLTSTLTPSVATLAFDDNTTDMTMTNSTPVVTSTLPGMASGEDSSSSEEDEDPENEPNTALLSFILTMATFLIAFYLKRFRNGKYLGRTARRAVGDFGVPIAIFVMVIVDVLIDETYTEKLDVPDGFEPTDAEKRDWFINPMGMEKDLPVWAIFAAAIPALLVFILIFMETMITNIIVTKKLTPENKGPGYHWTMLVIGCFASVTGLFGLPFLTAATVRSVTHTNALQVFGNTAPGEKPKLEEVKEQRVTGVLVHIMIGVSVMLGPLLREIPLAVLFGVFLYMGVASMGGVQLFDRIYLLFKPVKYHPYIGYVKNVKTWRMNLFTFVQIVCLGVLWAVKSTQAALAFPFVLILLIPVRRYILPKVFTETELDELDADGHKKVTAPEEYDSDDEEDEIYSGAHMSSSRA